MTGSLEWSSPECWDDERVAALPPYLAERPRLPVGTVPRDRRQPAHFEPATRRPGEDSWAWLSGAGRAGSKTGSGAPLVTVSKRLELPPSSAAAAVQRWWREHEQAPWLAAGRDWLELDHPDASAILGYLYRLFGRLHMHHAWPTVHVELDLSAWSFSESELELRPQRIPRGSYREARFFAAAHAMVEELARQVTAVTIAPATIARTATTSTG